MLLVAAEQSATRPDPRAALAAQEQEVGTAWSAIWSCRSRGQIKVLHHQLAGALIGIAGIPVGPDMGAGLGADLDDVVAIPIAGFAEQTPTQAVLRGGVKERIPSENTVGDQALQGGTDDLVAASGGRDRPRTDGVALPVQDLPHR